MGRSFDRSALGSSESVVYMYKRYTDLIFLFDDKGEVIPKKRTYVYLSNYEEPGVLYQGRIKISKLEVVNTVKYVLDVRLGKIFMF